MNNRVTILQTLQSIRFRVDEQGYVIGGPGCHMSHFMEPYAEWVYDFRMKKWVLLKNYRYYNRSTKWLHMPRYDLSRFLDHISKHGMVYEITDIPSIDGIYVEIPLHEWVVDRDDRQTKAINYLTTTDDPVRGVALQPGVGKTYVTIKSASILQRRTMVCVSGLIGQWAEAIKRFTTLTDDDIYVIQGVQSLIKLAQNIDKTIFPKFILCSTGTIRNWAQDKDVPEILPSFDEMCKLFSIGLRVTDEAHLNFHTNLIMDLRLNSAINIVLTATFDNSKPKIKTIFDSHYPSRIRFGENDYKSYTEVYAYGYSSGCMTVPKFAYASKDGYSHIRYETWLLNARNAQHLRRYIEELVIPICEMHYLNRHVSGYKMLIICMQTDMCYRIAHTLSQRYKDLKTSVYVFDTSDDVLNNSDFIVSTPKSAGTGRDISKLMTLLCLPSIRSSPLNQQIHGRLRELPGGPIPQMIYIYDYEIKPQVDHHIVRKSIFSPRCTSFKEARL